jgi:superfamily II DNA/RNA helicase
LQLINLDVDFIIANPMRFLEILAENENIVNMLSINFLIVDEYIQFRKMQTMDYVKKLVEKLRVKKQNL